MILTLRELAEYLRVSERTIMRMKDNGTIKGQKIGGQWRFLGCEIDKLMLADKSASTPEEEDEKPASTRPGIAIPLSRVMDKSRMVLNLDVTDAEVAPVVNAAVKRLCSLAGMAAPATEDAAPSAEDEAFATAIAQSAMQKAMDQKTGAKKPQFTKADATSIIDSGSLKREVIIKKVIEKLTDPRFMSGIVPDINDLRMKCMQREEMLSTSVGDSIAIPHPRDPIATLRTSAAIVYGYSKNGIDFNAPDGQPVHHFFLLCSQNIELHLHLMSCMANLLRDHAVLQAIPECKTPEDVIKLVMEHERNEFLAHEDKA